ncbi:hypothetical protein BH11ACT5_BH11ACT5_15160 [soil metagenome]
MDKHSRARPRVLTVGAFERDNFGDVLFLILTRGYLEEAGMESVAASTLTTRVPGEEGGIVRPAAALLTEERWHAVWVVGGEIGGVRIDGAFGMTLPARERNVFARANPDVREMISQFIAGTGTEALAYLPDPALFPLNSETPLIVNSIGLSNLRHGLDDEAAGRSDVILRRAARTLVREEESRDYAAAHGFDVDLGPDMVHAISLRPGFLLREMPRPTEKPYVLVQINTETIRARGMTELTASIADLSRRLDVDVRLFAAGTANAHDSLEIYDVIVELARRDEATDRISVISARDPRLLARWVAHAHLWIGTSLHGRIISSSYGVPRVTLQNDKVARYAATWDPAYPAGIIAGDWNDAVDAALALRDDPREQERSAQLAEMANDNTRRLVGEIT